jgi:leader peptidase (prepilin peptidase)/N-methyltransferase
MSPLELEFANAWIVYLAALIFGCNVGSFLNVVVFRVPRACVGVDRPRWSFCPSCRRRLRWHENIPVFGWLRLKGRCAGCQLPISPRYPLVEAFFGLLWLAFAWRFLQPGKYDFTSFLLLSIASLWIISAALIDWDLRLLPDQLTLSGLMVVLVAAPLAPGLYGMPRLSTQIARVSALLSGPWRDAPGTLPLAEWLSAWSIPANLGSTPSAPSARP